MLEIKNNLLKVMERIEKAAQRSGRGPEGGQAGCRLQDRGRCSELKKLLEAGVSILGENYVQEAQKKIEEIGRSVAWHFIGHLQSNKAKHAVRLFDVVHSVDSLALAEELNRRAEQAGRVLKVMMEVNLSGETTKFGADEESVCLNLAKMIRHLHHLSLEGLMTMPPYFDSPEMSRPYYIGLRELKERMVRGRFSDEGGTFHGDVERF